MFFVISCGGSKKTENPCDPNPCEGKEHATGECIAEEWHDNMGGYHSVTCVCETRSYYWNGWKCTNECEGDPCQYEEHAIADSCSLFDTPTAYECDCEEGYHWAYFDCEQDSEDEPDESTDTDEENPCNPNPCKDMEHSTGKCIQSYSEVNGDKYQCECVENAVWDGYIREKKCITPCDPNPCENEELSTGVCSIVYDSDEFYKCECVKENHYWCQGRCTDGSDGSCN